MNCAADSARFTGAIRQRLHGATASADSLGLTNLPGPPPPGYGFPAVTLAGFLGTYPVDTIDINPSEGTYQGLDTLTWTKSKHTIKFGGDFRYLSALFTNVFADYRMGTYNFSGSSERSMRC